MNEIFLQALGLFFTTAIGGYGGYYFTKRKYNAEATANEIDNGAKLVGMYKDALNDLPTRYEARFKTLEELFSKKEEILKQEIMLLKKERDFWKKRYVNLSKDTKANG